MDTRSAGADPTDPDRAIELDRARVRFLLPGIRRGFILSVVPIAVIAIMLRSTHAPGTATWVVVRILLSGALLLTLVRMGDGLDDPRRTLRRLTIVMIVGSVGWGLLPVIVRSDELEAHAVMTFVVMINVAIVTSACAADRRVYLAGVLPVSSLGIFGLTVMNHDVAPILMWLTLLTAPYSYAMFLSGNRALIEGFEHESRYRDAVAELVRGQADLRAVNERLQLATTQQMLLLDERAALIAAVGHDLGSPLGAAMLTAEVLADRHDALPAERHPELARRIHTQVHDAIVVLRDLTSTQRLSETDIEARRTQIDLHDIVGVVVGRADAEQQIRSEVPPESWLWADPALLERILDNLVGNAIKYTPSRSQIDIGCHIGCGIGCDIGDDPSAVSLVWVDDDGPGLAAGMEETVFEPYVRGLATSATSGSGVGLFLVRTFARLHGGEVWWEPSARGGSRFVVSLPNRPADDQTDDQTGSRTGDRTHGVTADG